MQYFSIFPKISVEKGEQPIFISVVEHYNSYQYILSKKTKQLSLRVE